MNPTENQPSLNRQVLRIRVYGAALMVALVYLLVGRMSSNNMEWVQVYLPVSAAAVLLITAASIESYFLIRQWQKRHAELVALRAREQELAQKMAAQRQTILSQLSRSLLDKLDCHQIPAEVLEKIALLFETDVVAIWVAEQVPSAIFQLQGVTGLSKTSAEKLTQISGSGPCFDRIVARARQAVVTDIGNETAPAFAAFCREENFPVVVFNPIISRDAVAGMIGVFYRQAQPFPAPLAAELQTIANLIASAIQAEALYRDLIQIQRIDSLGSLASGIAHDFNNVLAAILGCTSYVKQQTNPASPIYRYLEATEHSAHRGAALTKQLLSFVRREGPRAKVMDVNAAIEQMMKMLEHSFDKTILLHRHLDKTLRPVEVDPAQFEQILLNIAVNARDAMPEGGAFTIATRNVALNINDPHRPAISLPDGAYVAISFRDTGQGMNEATLKHIFEPFFTTKTRGHGTGLGLSVVQSIVRSFGGEIRAAAAPGKGALFEVYLPATDKPLPPAPAAPTAKARGGQESILLVEDEEVIREMAKLELEARGYRVLVAVDGMDALERYRQEWQRIDLVVADMGLPRLSGPQLFARMKEINPNVRVVVSSGYSHDLEGQQMLAHGCLGFLQKPYDAEALCQAVRAVFDSGL